MGVVYKVWVEVEEFNNADDSSDDVVLAHGPLAEFATCQEALQFVDLLHEKTARGAMNWNRIEQELIAAILARDIQRIGQITDRMRCAGKLNYDQSFEVAHKLTGITAGDWDDMLYEADQLSSSR